MRHHSQSRTRVQPPGAGTEIRSSAPRTGFLDTWAALTKDVILPTVPRRRGRKPRGPLTQLLPALIFHVMQEVGTLSEHAAELFGESLADSSWSDRRRRLPWEICAELMRRVLRPRATAAQPAAFWRGWRLVAIDGTQFSLTNTPQIRAARVKARSRRGRAAFAKLPAVVLVELGLHNPLAAAIGRQGESEWVLAHQVLPQMPPRALLLGDRLYGCAAFVAQAWPVCQACGSHVLVRVRSRIVVEARRRLRDGSRLVRVPVRDPEDKNRVVTHLDLREIRVRVGRPGHRAVALRLWTTLGNPRTAPAGEVAELYARRWEHELYFRELKRELRKSDLLHSQTVDTAAQEVAAVVVASAVLAATRASATDGELPALRVSFRTLLRIVQALWVALDVGRDILSERQKQQLVERGEARMRTLLTPRRRPRTCPRKVRRPVTRWPRLMRNESVEAPFQFQIV